MKRMMLIVTLMTTLATVTPPLASATEGGGAAAETYVPNCPSKYKDISEFHTMCLVDVAGAQEVTLNQTEKDAIVNKHNDFRSLVSPTATNLVKVVWDDDIAVVASKWARQCKLEHDYGSNRTVPELPGISIGQNGAWGHSSVVKAVIGWHSEVSNFEYGTGQVDPKGTVVGHYTQVVNYRVLRIGCGMSQCPGADNNRYQFCNYAEGQYQSAKTQPYESGVSASKCPADKRENNLCNCGGIVCLNGGTFNIGTCSCQCNSGYTGSLCETQNSCPNTEQGLCAVYKTKYCSLASYKYDSCPYTCGVCQKPSGCDLVCENGSAFKTNPCSCVCESRYYSGPTCSQLTCPSSSDSWCASKGSTFCTDFSNAPFLCPLKCNQCS